MGAQWWRFGCKISSFFKGAMVAYSARRFPRPEAVSRLSAVCDKSRARKTVAGLAHVEGPHGVCGQRVNVCMPLARARGTDAMALAWAWRTVCACEVW